MFLDAEAALPWYRSIGAGPRKAAAWHRGAGGEGLEQRGSKLDGDANLRCDGLWASTLPINPKGKGRYIANRNVPLS
jgi:hypothetical protein